MAAGIAEQLRARAHGRSPVPPQLLGDTDPSTGIQAGFIRREQVAAAVGLQADLPQLDVAFAALHHLQPQPLDERVETLRRPVTLARDNSCSPLSQPVSRIVSRR